MFYRTVQYDINPLVFILYKDRRKCTLDSPTGFILFFKFNILFGLFIGLCNAVMDKRVDPNVLM